MLTFLLFFSQSMYYICLYIYRGDIKILIINAVVKVVLPVNIKMLIRKALVKVAASENLAMLLQIQCFKLTIQDLLIHAVSVVGIGLGLITTPTKLSVHSNLKV